jgi:low temperature requirement protein LtrA
MLHTKYAQLFGPERRVAWLELFYDLVYVATLIQLGNTLAEDISWTGFLKFVALFIPFWWSWTGITFYFNRFVVDDIWHRILIFSQIFFIVILGISVQGAFSNLTTQFVLAYVGVRLIMILLYLRAGKHQPAAKPLINRYVVGFSLAVLVWLISIFVPPPYNYALWGVAILIDFATPTNPGTRKLFNLLPPHHEHMMERYALLVIIVLGESFVKVISSGSGLALTLQAVIFILFALLLTFSLWWHYFQDIADAEIVPSGVITWIYTHLPLTLSLTAIGVATKKLFLITPENHGAGKYGLLMGGTVALYLLCIAILNLVTERHGETNRRARAVLRLAAAVIALVLALAGSNLSPIIFAALIATIIIIPIAVDIFNSSRSTVAAAEPHE